jgi:Zn ribbon nucleic-acid-binding protein
MRMSYRWLFAGFENGLMLYKCSNCGYVKKVMKAGFNPRYTKLKRYVAKCPNCNSLNSY